MAVQRKKSIDDIKAQINRIRNLAWRSQRGDRVTGYRVTNAERAAQNYINRIKSTQSYNKTFERTPFETNTVAGRWANEIDNSQKANARKYSQRTYMGNGNG